MIYNKGHRKAVPLRKRDRDISRSVEQGIGSDRPSSGFGYIIIPSDTDRQEYINYVYRTGTCIIATSFNDVYKGVRVPKHMLDDIEFPEDYKEYGQLVSWVNTPVINQVTLYGFIQAPDEVYSRDEFTHGKTINRSGKSFSKIERVRDTSINYTVRMEDFSGENVGEMTFSTSSSMGMSKVVLTLEGKAEMYSDVESLMKSYEQVRLETGTEADENLSTLLFNKDGLFEYKDFNGNYVRIEEGKITIESPDGEILHGGGATEWTIKGETTKTELEKLSSRVDLLYQAIQSGVPAAGSADGGSAYKASMAGILSTALSESWTGILSEKNKVE